MIVKVNLTDNVAQKEARVSEIEAELARSVANCARLSQVCSVILYTFLIKKRKIIFSSGFLVKILLSLSLIIISSFNLMLAITFLEDPLPLPSPPLVVLVQNNSYVVNTVDKYMEQKAWLLAAYSRLVAGSRVGVGKDLLLL